MRSEAWLAAPCLLAHANVTENINIFSMGPRLRYPTEIVASASYCSACMQATERIPSELSPALRGLITAMVQQEPSARPTPVEAFRHACFIKYGPRYEVDAAVWLSEQRLQTLLQPKNPDEVGVFTSSGLAFGVPLQGLQFGVWRCRSLGHRRR